VLNVLAGVPDGRYQAGDVIPILVHFSRPVTATGTPQLALATGVSGVGVATYSSGSGTSTLTFNYMITNTQFSARLDYMSPSALTTPTGSSIKDALNQNPAILMLPVPGLAGSLSQGSLLIIGNPLSVGQVPGTVSTSLSLQAPQTVLAGEVFTLAAMVSSTTPGDTTLTGEVIFYEGVTVLGSAPLVGEIATLSLALPVGNHSISAAYQGDESHEASVSDLVTIQVNRVVVSGSAISVENPDGSQVLLVRPYGKTARTNFTVAEGALNASGAPELVVAPKPGVRKPVEVISGTSGKVLRRIFPFGRVYAGGVSLAVADLNGDHVSDIITAPARGTRTKIKVYDGATGKLVRTTLTFRGLLHGGLQLSTRDVNNDGTPDIIAQTHTRRATLVEVFNGRTGAQIGGIQKIPSGPALALRKRR
jgi:hypothetical protein